MTVRTDLISEREWEQLKEHLGLDGRQADIMRLTFLGKTDEEIARALGILTRTVRTQIDHLYRTFGLSSRLHLILLVLASLRECWTQGDISPS